LELASIPDSYHRQKISTVLANQRIKITKELYLMFGDSVAHVVLGSEFLHRKGDSILGDANFKGGKLVPFLKHIY
jgi:hypothetical protein